jgi:hypothetical protein
MESGLSQQSGSRKSQAPYKPGQVEKSAIREQ